MVIFVIIAVLFFVFGIPYLISSVVDPKGTSEVIGSIFKKEKKYNVQDEMSLFNDAEWVKKVILSCNSTTQIWKAYKLSEFLRKKYYKKVNRNVIRMVNDDICKTFDTYHHKLIYNRK